VRGGAAVLDGLRDQLGSKIVPDDTFILEAVLRADNSKSVLYLFVKDERTRQTVKDKIEVVRPPQPENLVGIFLSYRRADSQEVVGRMYDRLIKHFPIDRVFRDLDNLQLGTSFPHALDEAVTNANVALIVIGPNWVNIKDTEGRRRLDSPSDFVRLEVEKALGAGIPVVPVFVTHASMPNSDDLPESLRPLVFRHGISVRPDPDFHRDMDRLIGKLSSLLDSTTVGGSTPDTEPLGSISEVDKAIQGLYASYPGDREKAARRLGSYGVAAADAVPALRKALKDSSGPVRTAALWALRAIGTPEAIKAVKAFERR
jgi:hypothetical protein